jgi:hypothetical protein
MLDKKRGYAEHRPFYAVDPNALWNAGMVAFLTTNANGVGVATTSALSSGGVPIGTFWKDKNTAFNRTTVESGTFASNNTINLLKGNVRSGEIKVTNVANTVEYTNGVDYSVVLANGVVTRIGTGSIAASATVIVWYGYDVLSGQEHWDLVGTQWSTGVNYDRQANDTLGSSEITIAEGIATLYTDQYDVTQTYTLNAALRSDANSLWTSAVVGAGLSSPCGRVVSVPNANDPFLGLEQIRIVS